jgi:(R)-2-hydroxyacyl-CoA dehydratese activating ATPase
MLLTTPSVVAGIDLGSTSIKVVLYDGVRYTARMKYATWNPGGIALGLLDATCAEIGMDGLPALMATTGYGRRTMPESSLTYTEIACHARGASFLVPQCRFVIDIGGQDAKGIRLTPEGKVADFVMNDKCAAGTGRFLTTTGQALGVHVDQLSKHALGKAPHRINAM